MCFPTGLHYPIILPFGKFAYTFSRKSSHKDTSTSVIFWTLCISEMHAKLVVSYYSFNCWTGQPISRDTGNIR